MIRSLQRFLDAVVPWLAGGIFAVTAWADDVQVNTYTTGFQRVPSVAAGPDGDFVVVWHSYRADGYALERDSIQARRFASDGSSSGDQFQVNLDTPGVRYGPAVASSANGDFVVVWGSYLYDYYYPPVASIHGRRFASDGTPRAPSSRPTPTSRALGPAPR